MDFEAFRDLLPEYAKDIKINLSTVLSTDGAAELSELQIAGVALASAYAIGEKKIIEIIDSKFASQLSEEIRKASKAAASIMSMNNIYYRFVHLANDPEISKLPARLRMNIISNSGVPKTDFELMSTAVSAINGCGACMEAHTKELIKHGVSRDSIQAAVKIAAILSSAAKVSEIEGI